MQQRLRLRVESLEQYHTAVFLYERWKPFQKGFFYHFSLEPEYLRREPYREGILVLVHFFVDSISGAESVYGAVFFQSKCVKRDIVVYMTAYVVVRIGDIQDKKIVPSFDE